MIAILMNYWKPILAATIIAGASWISYNYGYDRRDMIAVKQEQQYQEALQESLRKKYSFERVFVPKYVEQRREYEQKVETIIEDIGKIPVEQVADCRVPDDAIRLWNESLFDNAGTTEGIDDANSSVPGNSTE